MLFKTCVKYKPTGSYSIIESDYKTKAQFIQDLRSNGYAVNPLKVKEVNLYNWIIENTDCEEHVWKYLNKIPKNYEEYRGIIEARTEKDDAKHTIRFNKLMKECDKSHQQFLKDFNLTEEEFQADIKARKGL